MSRLAGLLLDYCRFFGAGPHVAAESGSSISVESSDRLARWAHWPRRTESPYYPMFYGAMRAHGIEPVPTLQLSADWLRLRQADAIHVHWPDGMWRQQGKGAIARVRGVWRLGRFLRAARRGGVRIVWTVHNLGPHEGGDRIDGYGYRAVARAADLIICHSQWSADEVTRTYRPGADIVVMPHGNFDGFYPEPRTREVTLTSLGLDPARPVVSCLGYLRKYKGMEIACDAVARLEGVQLVIAGPRFPRYDLEPLRRALRTVRDAVLIDRRLSDQEFADLTAASDASLLPYTAVTTSGVLVSSWSLGTPVVASDLPLFRELIPEPGPAARLFPAGDAAKLAEAIRALLGAPRDRRVAASRELAARYSWPACVTPVARWLAQFGGPASGGRTRGASLALDA
jgi:beta-1,4-mannosyltransferase